MNKVASALGFFMLGACSMLWFIYTSTDTQALSAEPPKLGVPLEKSIPIVPPLPTVDFRDVEFRNGIVQLDGLNCERCMFKNVLFEYSGGLINLVKASWKPGTIQVAFKGCAHNTMQVLELATIMTAPPRPKASPPTPKQKDILIKTDMTVDWIVR